MQIFLFYIFFKKWKYVLKTRLLKNRLLYTHIHIGYKVSYLFLTVKKISLWCIMNIFLPIILCFYLVIVLAVRGESLRKLMIHAHEMGLIQENYIFICVYYYPHKNTFGDISWKQVALVYFSVNKIEVLSLNISFVGQSPMHLCYLVYLMFPIIIHYGFIYMV